MKTSQSDQSPEQKRRVLSEPAADCMCVFGAEIVVVFAIFAVAALLVRLPELFR